VRTEVEVGVDEGCESILVIQIRIEIIPEAEMFFVCVSEREKRRIIFRGLEANENNSFGPLQLSVNIYKNVIPPKLIL
jgi:hypothetical protein